MNILIAIIAPIIVFSVLVVIHEWGHFIVARRNGIKVEEFGFGLPPRIWGYKKGETLYSINAVPFGGFVKLMGEDATDPKINKDPRSFSSKSLWVRARVILAGVFMNFLLAIVLLTIGFSFGIQPLILSADDVFKNIDNGTIEIASDVRVKTVLPGIQNGIQVGDQIIALNNEPIVSTEQVDTFLHQNKKEAIQLDIVRNGQTSKLNIAPDKDGNLGFTVYDPLFIPHQAVAVTNDSLFAKAGLTSNDVILKANNKYVYTQEDLQAALKADKTIHFSVLHDHSEKNIDLTLSDPVDTSSSENKVVITDILPGTPAEKAGFLQGDVIESVEGKTINQPGDLLSITKQSIGKTLDYKIARYNTSMDFQVIPDKNGLIGVGISSLTTYSKIGLAVYDKDVPSSVMTIHDVRYPVWQAPVEALKESGRLTVLTVEMFGNLIRSLVTRFTVPEGVTGPVGIVQLTYTFVQEGVLSTLRFMALISLSLAIINVIPFPALDGGRLLFIIIEAIAGKRIKPRYEALIHAIGFVLLMLLILAVTYSDILKIF